MANLTQNIAQVNADFQAIKTKIKNCGVEVADGTPTSQYSSKVSEVYEAGKKAENDAFWDRLQENGNRVSYRYIFSGGYWTAETFKPKYDIVNVKNCEHMFARCEIASLVDLLEQSGIVFDVSNSENHISMFTECWMTTEIPPIDLSKSKYATNLFNQCSRLKGVEITIAENTVPNYSGWFNQCKELENLKVNGVFDKNALNLQHSTKLSKASITSVINALSTTTSGISMTLSKTAVNTAFETSTGAADGSTSAEWQALVATKINWTISLI